MGNPLMRARLAAAALLIAMRPRLAAPASPGQARLAADVPLAEAEAANARNECCPRPRGPSSAAQASDDEAIAEQASRYAYENHQLNETLLAAKRWLEINPSSEQARRYAGVAALGLHRSTKRRPSSRSWSPLPIRESGRRLCRRCRWLWAAGAGRH